MIYELRIYRCVPGRKPALLSRFENSLFAESRQTIPTVEMTGESP
jgi:hypothetical protein